MASRSTSKSGATDAQAQIRAYFVSLSPDARKDLRKVRNAIRAAAPGAEEGFSYRMPSFRLDGRPLVWYAAFKSHTSMFPIGPAIVKGLGLTGYKTSTGTIQFPLTKPPSAALVKRIVRARIAELEARGK